MHIPHVLEPLHKFLEPTFADSPLYAELEPSSEAVILGMAAGSLLGLLGIFIAWQLWVKHPERPAAIRARLGGLHRFFVNKWYFDEAIDLVFVRPAGWVGRFAPLDDRARPRQRRARRRRVRRRARRLGRGARHPDGLPALLRRAAARRPHRPRRLLPDLRMTIHLSILIFWPLAFGVLGAIAPRRAAPVFALVGALVPLAYAVLMLFDFEPGARGLQYLTDDEWIPDLGIHYRLGVDGLNLWLVALTTLLFAASALWLIFRPPPARLAVRAALRDRRDGRPGRVPRAGPRPLRPLLRPDAGAVLLPGRIWGGPDRIAAAVKMVVYTLVGSLLMLAAAAATAVLSARGPGELSFAFSDLVANRLPESTQKWIFVAFALAFLIKMPAFPFHGWMPDAYRAMPLPALAVFSGVVSKVAAYGFLRIALPLFPDAVARLPDDPARGRAALDPLRLGDGVHADQRAADPRLLLDGPARVHHARDLRRRQRRGRARRAR